MNESKFLIAVGSPESPGQAFLPRVGGDISRMESLFCGPPNRYTRVLREEIPINAPASVIRNRIVEWFSDDSRVGSDIVVLYFAGHGGDAGRAGNYYVFTADTNDKDLSGTAVNVARLFQDIYDGAGDRPKNVLLILDTCFSGRAASEIASFLGPIRNAGIFREGAGLWIVSTSDPLSKSGDGPFVDALLSVLKDPAWAPEGGAEYLHPIDAMVYGVNEWLTRNKLTQQAEWDVFSGRERPMFLRNPHHTTTKDGYALLDESHWIPKVRGDDSTDATGWFFTGRKAALRALIDFLNAPEAAVRGRVVTGRPGSGKSAVLARIVTMAHGPTKERMIREGAPDPGLDAAPPAIDAYVHAKGLSAERIADSIARQLFSVQLGAKELVKRVHELTRPVRVIVDALDEASAPREAEETILRPLLDCEAVRLITGSRVSGHHTPLAGAAEVVNLDDPVFFDRADLVEYVARRLRPMVPTDPSDRLRMSRLQKLAEDVASRAGHSFLFARIAARALAAGDTLSKLGDPDWRPPSAIPVDLQQAFVIDLERFPEEERVATLDLLIPLAWAKGKGLPQKDIWADLASRISGRTYSNDDIERLKERAGYYIVQDTDGDDVVYRLFHEAFAEYLREQTRGEEIDRQFLDLFAARATTPDGKRDWSRLLDPYAVQYLPAHAVSANLLDSYIQDADFLLNVRPEALLPFLRSVRDPNSVRAARAYRQASHRLRAQEISTRLAYLLRDARQVRADSLANSLEALSADYECAALPVWADWSTTVVSDVVAEVPGGISAFTFYEDEGDPVVIAGVDDRVAVYDGITGRELSRSDPLGMTIEHIACMETKDQAYIMAAGRLAEERGAQRSAALVALRYPECVRVASVPNAHTRGVYPLSGFGTLNTGDAQYAVTSGDETAVRLWSIPDLQLVAENTEAYPSTIYRVFGVNATGEPVLICGSDSVAEDGQSLEEGPLLCAMKLPNLEVVRRIFAAKSGLVRYAIPLEVLGRTILAVTYDYHGVKVVDMDRERVLGSNASRVEVFGAAKRSDSEFLVFGTYSSQFYVLQVQIDGDSQSAQIDVLPSRAEVRGNKWLGPVGFRGREVVLSKDGDLVRAWDVAELLSADTTPKLDVLALAVSSSDSGKLCTVNGAGTVTLYRASDGQMLRDFDLKGAKATATSAAFIEGSGKEYVVFGTRAGEIVVCDTERRGVERTIRAGNRVDGLACCEYDGVRLCFAATDLNPVGQENEYRLTIWDLDSGDERTFRTGPRPAEQLRLSGYRDKSFGCVATARVGGDTMLFAAGPHSFVQAWKLKGDLAVDSGEYWIEPLRGNNYINALAVQSRPDGCNIAAGNDQGIVCVWDCGNYHAVQMRERAHKSGITSLAYLPGTSLLVSAGTDQMMRVWSGDLRELLAIDMEEIPREIAAVSRSEVAVITDSGVMVFRLNLD
jgi:WD40 repeat protein